MYSFKCQWETYQKGQALGSSDQVEPLVIKLLPQLEGGDPEGSDYVFLPTNFLALLLHARHCERHGHREKMSMGPDLGGGDH